MVLSLFLSPLFPHFCTTRWLDRCARSLQIVRYLAYSIRRIPFSVEPILAYIILVNSIQAYRIQMKI